MNKSMENLEEKLVNLLIERGYTISFAESCTGGLLAARLINVSNASKVINASFVTYANEAKEKYLSVKEETIAKYDVVSEEVAKEMALGLKNETGANIAISTTGLAGPTGGTIDRPVGMVCFGFAINNEIYTSTIQFGNIGRNEVRKAASDYVFTKALELLEKNIDF